MTTLTATPAPVNASPADWPAWTDEDRWGIGPDPDDAAWWDVETRESGPDYDELAEEAAEMDAYEMGILPL